MIFEALKALATALTLWRNHIEERAGQGIQRTEAIGKVMDAAIATKAYLRDRSDGLPQDRSREEALARHWQSATTAIYRFDPSLAESTQIKALGWSDPNEWRQIEGRESIVRIETIIEQCHWLQRNG